ncbi:hypothetical protein IQ03_04495 [Gemmobacter caeni]|jgi:hypothetical protein|uniref:Ig-like domain-containing protein n=1 Tax=Gemmobacter caeni TaxID=589035 RepID=A0A2T6AP57_9RHOB|nr:hypothetical protein [Gemmobacter caeni]PTX45587.1 hypothetical protein C8N34_12116 [Gemmobacter caeni]TWI93735.1 hypothetical protein IQ03_04495 [Gemmobacter caeni]
MRKIFGIAAAVALISGFAGGAHAADPVTVYCTTGKQTKGSPIPPDMIIQMVPGTGVAVVADGLTQKVTGGSVSAKVTQDDDRQATFKWEVRGAKGRNARNASLAFTGTLIKATNEIRLSVIPRGFDNRFTSRGQCEVRADAPKKRKK